MADHPEQGRRERARGTRPIPANHERRPGTRRILHFPLDATDGACFNRCSSRPGEFHERKSLLTRETLASARDAGRTPSVRVTAEWRHGEPMNAPTRG